MRAGASRKDPIAADLVGLFKAYDLTDLLLDQVLDSCQAGTSGADNCYSHQAKVSDGCTFD